MGEAKRRRDEAEEMDARTAVQDMLQSFGLERVSFCDGCRGLHVSPPYELSEDGRVLGVEVCGGSCGKSFGVTYTPEQRAFIIDKQRFCLACLPGTLAAEHSECRDGRWTARRCRCLAKPPADAIDLAFKVVCNSCECDMSLRIPHADMPVVLRDPAEALRRLAPAPRGKLARFYWVHHGHDTEAQLVDVVDSSESKAEY